MDARVAEFMQIMGMEETYRTLIMDEFQDLEKTPAFKGVTFDRETKNRLALKGAKELVLAYGNLMEDKFRSQPQYLDALLAYMKTPSGHHIVFGLYMVQTQLGAAIKGIFPRLFAELTATGRK